MKIILIGRHSLLPAQEADIKKYFGTDVEILRVPTVTNTKDVVDLAVKEGATAIVIQSLPLSLTVDLVAKANRVHIPVLYLKMKSGPVLDKEAAETWMAADPDRRTYIPSAEGNYRVIEYQGFYLIKGIVIEEEKVL